ncbi:4ca8363a-49ab-4da6-9c08-6ed9979d6367 [Sclerotinia trifoliorum]|uniref:4ca8363a-49ab-4da6-9c08-6ed9979d6367 n=1 Tax=Sclerotinia trifoliorum TaxID=28548 RepID=A0A8H2ZNG3_9HELO|nr:4ca8363a-49ab-4da6-9c08-6ed9979d6367 [Sclerotinia trifoliorum]
MAGTPIKVPGKYTRDSSKSAVLARKILKRPRGRPLKQQSSKLASHISQSLSTTARESKVRTMRNIKSRRNMSQLEKLPTELLEAIFFYCLNLNFPVCSPIIGGKLSGESVYSKTIIAAFDPIWDGWYGQSIIPNSSLEMNHTGSGNLRSAILKRRWARVPVLIRSQDLWVRKYAQGRPFPTTIIQRLWNGPFGNDICGSGIKDVDPKTVSAVHLFDNDFAKFCYIFRRAEQTSDFIMKIKHLSGAMMYDHVNMATGTEIPNTLLVGPWDEEAIKFLYWLVMGGARIDWLTSTSGEAAIIGYKRAVRESRIEVIYLLLLAGIKDKLDGDIIQYVLENAEANRCFTTILMMMSPERILPSLLLDEMLVFKNSHEHENDFEKHMLIEELFAWFE